MKPLPKSYLKDSEREEGLEQEEIFADEAEAAIAAGDCDTAWAWLALINLPAETLMAIKATCGATFIREKELKTTEADLAYGAGWLDR